MRRCIDSASIKAELRRACQPKMRSKRDHPARDGFTLIEVLAALAISSVIIVTTAALIHTIAGNFDRGTRGVDAADRLVLAMQRLSSDFSSARFVVWTTDSGPSVAFKAEPVAGDKPARTLFVAGRTLAGEQDTDELISLTVERSDDTTRLVRRRAVWTGADMSVERASLQDPVVLIEGNLDISFLFGRLMPGGALIWSTDWVDQTMLPRFARLILRDRATGLDPVGEADFVLRADAPLACGSPDARPDCVSRALPAPKRRAALQRTTG
jgi:general secretion pathway protein J